MAWQPERRAETENSDDEQTDLGTNAEDQSLQVAPTAAVEQEQVQTEKQATGIPTNDQAVSSGTENPNIVGSTQPGSSNGDNDSSPSASASPSG
jgi:hypothetical protein